MSERGRRSWAWWQERATAYPPPLSMPMAATQPAGRADMKTVAQTIPADQWEAIERHCSRLGKIR